MPHVTEEIWSNLPARETRLIVAPWPDAATTTRRGGRARARAGGGAIVPAQRRAASTLEGEEQRIFDAVVQARAREARNGNAEAERARLRKEIERAEKMLANERFVANAPPTSCEAEREKLERYRRELDALGD